MRALFAVIIFFLTRQTPKNSVTFASELHFQIDAFQTFLGENMSRYATLQRKKLLEFLEKNPHSSFSARQIKDAILGVSMSAVYRNLAILEKDGLLQKVYVSNKKEITYQYVCSENCVDFLHLICEKCKKSSHFEKEFSELIVNKALEVSGFVVNRNKTFIYGVCQTCAVQSKVF